MYLVHAKIKSLVEIGTLWRKSLKFMCVEKFWCNEKIKSLKKKFASKHDAGVSTDTNWQKIKVYRSWKATFTFTACVSDE
jgi:hypothetical protein